MDVILQKAFLLPQNINYCIDFSKTFQNLYATRQCCLWTKGKMYNKQIQISDSTISVYAANSLKCNDLFNLRPNWNNVNNNKWIS